MGQLGALGLDDGASRGDDRFGPGAGWSISAAQHAAGAADRARRLAIQLALGASLSGAPSEPPIACRSRARCGAGKRWRARAERGLALFGRALSLSGDNKAPSGFCAKRPAGGSKRSRLADASGALGPSAKRGTRCRRDVLQGDTVAAIARGAERLGSLSRQRAFARRVDYTSQAVAAGRQSSRAISARRPGLRVGRRDGALDAVKRARAPQSDYAAAPPRHQIATPSPFAPWPAWRDKPSSGRTALHRRVWRATR